MTARTAIGLALAAGVCLTGPARAGTDLFGWKATGEIEVGGRATWGDTDAAKFREYRDLDDGFLGNFRLRLEDEGEQYWIRARGDQVGKKDQRYWLEGGRYGRFEVDLFYGELPHVFSSDARTLYQPVGRNSFQLPGGVQDRIAGSPDTASELSRQLRRAVDTSLGFKQKEGRAGVRLRLGEETEAFASYRIQDRRGNRAMAIQWGSPGGDFVVFPTRMDDQTHEVRGGLELDRGPLTLGVDYLGSFYDNALKDAIVDNPLVAQERANAARVGRTSMAPDNSAHSMSLSSSLVLPTSFPATIAGTFSYGLRYQNDGFLPHTINSAIQSPFLPQDDLEGEVHTMLGNIVATARPTSALSIKGRYRYYDYDDKSDGLRFARWVRNDDELRTDAVTSVRNEYTKQNGDLVASYRFTGDLTGHLGYGFEYWQRSRDRQVRSLWEHGPEAKLDWRLHEMATLRASYAFLNRNGRTYDSLAFFREHMDPVAFDGLVASGVTEIKGLRKFSQADRYVHRADLTAHLMPTDRVDLTLTGGLVSIDYHGSEFGMQDERTWHAGFDAGVLVTENVRLGAWYDYESEVYEQNSRWRPRNFVPPIVLVDSPLNDWNSKNRSHFHSLGLDLGVTALPDRLDFELGYEMHLGREKTETRSAGFFVSPAGPNTGADGGAPHDWPTVSERLHVVTARANFHVNERLTLRVQYRFEDFDLQDFRTDDLGPYRGGDDVFLGDTLRNYKVHLLALSAIFRF